MASLEAQIQIYSSIEEVFDFLARSENFLKIIPPELKVQVVAAPERLTLGSRFEVQIAGFGVPQKVIYEVTNFAEPNAFTEAQVQGPLGRYVQEHVISQQSDGTVLVTDRVEFEPPGGFLGLLLSADRLRTSLDQGLAYRHRELKRLLEGT